MKVASHLEKIARLELLRARLDPLADFELWFWAGMTAGTHAVNAALHHAGITDDGDAYPSQPGVYLVGQLLYFALGINNANLAQEAGHALAVLLLVSIIQ